jgi:hypothetical protein
MKKRKILFFFLILITVYLVWLAFQLITFKSYTTVPQKDSFFEVSGVFHIHSTFSDGKRSVDQIARCASEESLNFIVITDHGRPNFESLRSEGWKDEVLVLCGSELSENRGHLVAVGFDTPSSQFSSTAEEAVYQVAGLGGFTVIAHPYSKVQWSWGPRVDYSGLEIISADSMLRKSLPLSLFYLPALLINPKFAFLKVLSRPEKNLLKWDSLNEKSSIFGYYSTDAHLLYSTLFSSLHLHIPLARPLSKKFKTAKRQVLNALRRGNFYSAVEAAAQAKGFRFWAKQGDKVFSMGSAIKIEPQTTLHAAMPIGVELEARLLVNGTPVFRSSEETWSYPATNGPGVYRLEVYLKEKTPMAEDFPWILSNPIFLKEKINDYWGHKKKD